jgi:hypothetical protein
MPSRNARRYTATRGVSPAPAVPSFAVIRPSFLWCTKCFGKAEANYDRLIAGGVFGVDCQFNRLGSVLCHVCNASYDVCESVSSLVLRSEVSLTFRLGSDGDSQGGLGLFAVIRDV